MLNANFRIKSAQTGATETMQAEAQKHHNWFEKLERLFAGEALHHNLLPDGPATVEDEVIAKVERLSWIEQNPVNEKSKQKVLVFMSGEVCGEAKNNQAALIELLIGQTGASETSILCNENLNRESARCARNAEQKQQKIIHATGSRSVVGVRVHERILI